eukprot:5548790-Karenia_brevis.AAC.1
MAQEHTTVGSCSSAFCTKNMFSELYEEEEDDMEAISDDGSINLASEVSRALQELDSQTLTHFETNMCISEEVNPQEHQNKKGGPLP